MFTQLMIVDAATAIMTYFRILKTLTSKPRLSANLSCEYEFYLLENKKSYIYINGFALNLALKLRLDTNWKWPQIFIY